MKDITVNMLIKDEMDKTEISEFKRLHCVSDKIRLVLLKIARLEQSLISSSIEVQQKQVASIKTSIINILYLLGDEIDQGLRKYGVLLMRFSLRIGLLRILQPIVLI